MDKHEQRQTDDDQTVNVDSALEKESPKAAGDDSDDGFYGRWRRHIGSIAAFGGFPITNKNNKAANRPHSSALISRYDVWLWSMKKVNRPVMDWMSYAFIDSFPNFPPIELFRYNKTLFNISWHF